MPTEPHEPYLLEDLNYATAYLTLAVKESDEVFLLALRSIAKAQGKMNLLSDLDNPPLSSLKTILDQLGIEITFEKKLQIAEAG